MSASAVSTVSCLGWLLDQRMGIPPADSTRHLFQHCALWRGNAALWIRRFPTLAPSVVCVCVSECFCFYVLCVFFFFVPFFLFSFSLLSSVFFDFIFS